MKLNKPKYNLGDKVVVFSKYFYGASMICVQEITSIRMNTNRGRWEYNLEFEESKYYKIIDSDGQEKNIKSEQYVICLLENFSGYGVEDIFAVDK